MESRVLWLWSCGQEEWRFRDGGLVNLCSLRATGGDSKGRVLDGLKFFDIGDGCGRGPDWGGVVYGCGRGPDWGGVVYDGTDDGVVGEGDGGFVLSPCPTGNLALRMYRGFLVVFWMLVTWLRKVR